MAKKVYSIVHKDPLNALHGHIRHAYVAAKSKKKVRKILKKENFDPESYVIEKLKFLRGGELFSYTPFNRQGEESSKTFRKSNNSDNWDLEKGYYNSKPSVPTL